MNKFFDNEAIEKIKSEAVSFVDGFGCKFREKGCEFNYHFIEPKRKNSDAFYYEIIVEIYPAELSLKEAVKKHRYKCFKGKIARVKRKKEKLLYKVKKDILLSLYLRIGYIILDSFGADFYCRDKFIDFILRCLFPKRVESLKNKYKGKDYTAFVRAFGILAFIVFMVLYCVYIYNNPDPGYFRWILY